MESFYAAAGAVSLVINNVVLHTSTIMLAWVFKVRRSVLWRCCLFYLGRKKTGIRVFIYPKNKYQILKEKWLPLNSQDCPAAEFPTLKVSPSPAQITCHWSLCSLSFAMKDYNRWVFRLKRSTFYQCSGKKCCNK